MNRCVPGEGTGLGLSISHDIIVKQHATLAARDAYAARGGWIAERKIEAITYHKEYGEVGTITVTPEMLED